jgi:hypothetical protein
MPLSRRSFLGSAGAFAAASSALARRVSAEPSHPRPTFEELDRAAAAPILKTEDFKSPVKIESIELLRNGNAFLIRIRSTDGAEGLTVPNDDRMIEGYSIFLNRIVPFFVGKDVRALRIVRSWRTCPARCTCRERAWDLSTCCTSRRSSRTPARTRSTQEPRTCRSSARHLTSNLTTGSSACRRVRGME